MSGRIHVSPKADRTRDGITFASKAEMNHYAELKMLALAGLITELELQPKYILLPKQEGQPAITYVADFKYRDVATGLYIVEDVKGHKTEVYKIKRKLFRAKYPDIDFREVKV